MRMIIIEFVQVRRNIRILVHLTRLAVSRKHHRNLYHPHHRVQRVDVDIVIAHSP